MKKTIVFVTFAAMVLVIAASFVNAAPTQTPSPGPRANCPGFQATPLTGDQKQQMEPLYNQMLETKKQMLQKYVEFGQLTQEQADQRLAWMKERMANRMQYGACQGGPGMKGFGHKGHGPWQQQPAQQPPAANN